jgi:phage major head subunit gpT-like protein
MIITHSSLDALRVGFSQAFQRAYDETPVDWPAMATEVPSANKSNVYGWVAQSQKLREWTGARIAMNLKEHAFTIANKPFEGTVEVDRDDIEDDNLGTYATQAFPQLGAAMRKHPDRLLVDLIQSNPTAFDGETLFSDNHPCFDASSSTYDNNFSLALTADNIFAVYAAMCAVTGEDGEPLEIEPTELWVPPQLYKTALEICTAEFIHQIVSSVAAAPTNVLKGMFNVRKIKRFANESTTWYLADTSKPVKPFVYQVRRAPQFVAQTDMATSDRVFSTRKFQYGVDYRGNVGVTLPFLIAKSKPS